MAIIGRDTFYRGPVASGSWGTAIDGQVWSQQRGTQTLDVTGNKGRMTFVSVTTGVMVLGTNVSVDAEGLVRFNVSTATDLAGISLRFQDSNNFYSCIVGNTANTITFRKDVAGTFSTVGTAVTFTYSIVPFYWMRFRLQGTNLYAKAWADGTAEPQNWMMAATDASLTTPGRFGIVGTPAASTNVTQYDSFSVDDTLPPGPLTQPRWTPRALSALLFKPAPSVPLPAWVERAIQATFVRPTQPTNIPRYVPRGLMSTLANYALNITTRFRLMSANVLKDISTRFILVGGTQSIRDIATRFRLMQQSVRDIATRFRLASLRDIATRFRLGILKDVATRFRLKSADQLKDIASRFRLASVRDVATRFRLARLRDIATRFRLMSANQLKDVAARFRLMQQSVRDIASRFRLAKLNDVATRFRLARLRDISTRFILASASQRIKDVAT